MEKEHLRDWLALSLTPGLGGAGCRLLVDHFGDPGRVLAADAGELRRVVGLKKPVVGALLEGPRFTEADDELQRAEKAGVRVIAWDDADFPPLLRNIHNPPVLLYVKGQVGLLQGPCLGVVGARAATDYGTKMAKGLAGSLVKAGLVVVSGLALGVDSAAHRGTLAADGNTVAVLGCGVDVVYPASNRALYEQIAEQGALVSEYPLGTKPETFRFPARNRIISGLSLGVVVVEAARRSGSLITAHLALEQGREVFAVPGRADSFKSEGTHRLLQEGAKLVFSPDDILEELCLQHWPDADLGGRGLKVKEQAEVLDDPDEAAVFSFVDVYPQNIEELILKTGFSAQKTGEILLRLELKGAVAALSGQRYQRSS